MGLLNKIKGIFMEEVIEEVDEETKPIEKIKEKSPVAKKIETPSHAKEEEEVPIVREIPKEEPIKEEESQVEINDETKEFSKPIELDVIENEHRFPMQFDDKDFEIEDNKDKDIYVEEPISEPEPVKEEPILYHGRRTEREIEYRVESPVKVEPYEANNDKKTGFQRSPIISPVYGILDKNYRKEEIVSKREIRLMTNNQKGDLDLVREKAYGELANDITESIEEEKEDNKKKEPIKEEIIDSKEEKVDKDNLFYDLSEDASPSVKVVTVGDAEEYFNDLGLEYNVDYKVSTEDDKPVTKDIKEEKTEESETDDELFSLIDAMYDGK
jgi:hypothetical protein